MFNKLCDFLIWSDYTPIWLLKILAKREEKILQKLLDDFKYPENIGDK